MDAFLPPKRVEVTISYTAQIRIKKTASKLSGVPDLGA